MLGPLEGKFNFALFQDAPVSEMKEEQKLSRAVTFLVTPRSNIRLGSDSRLSNIQEISLKRKQAIGQN